MVLSLQVQTLDLFEALCYFLITMKKVKFNPVLSTKKLLGSLDERPRLILINRFGLESNNPRTLESIGREYGITRERVRQIEAFALNKIRKSSDFASSHDNLLLVPGMPVSLDKDSSWKRINTP